MTDQPQQMKRPIAVFALFIMTFAGVSGGPKLHRSGGRKCHTWRSSSSGCEAPSVSSVS